MPLYLKLIVLVAVSLLTRIIFFIQPQILPLDGVLWIKMAKLFSEGGYTGVAGSYFNFYPFLIYLAQKFFGDWELSGRIISLAAGTLTVIPVFLLGRSLFDEKIGWLSAIFYLTLPNFLEYDSQVLRDPLLWFFMAITFWLIWEGIRSHRSVCFGFGSITAGLGALTRVEGFIVWLILVVYTAARRKKEISVRKKIWNLSLFTLLFPLLISIGFFSLKGESSRKAFAFEEMTSFSINFIKSHTLEILKPRDPIHAMGEKNYHSLPNISKDSLELGSRHRILLAISEVIYKFVKSSNLLFLFILLGFWKRKKEGFQSNDGFLLFVFGGLFIMSVLYARQLYYFSTRHGITLVLPTLFFAGHGLNFISEAAPRRFHHLTGRYDKLRQYLPHVMTILLAVAFLIQGIPSTSGGKLLQKEAGLWLREEGHQGSVVMGPQKYFRIAFYAEAEFLQLPDSWEKTTSTIQEKKVRLIVTDPSTIEQDCPGFMGNWKRSGLVLLQEIKGKRATEKIQIYLVQN